MKKICILIMLLLIFGCSNKDNSMNSLSEGVGYILEVTESRILVIEDKYLNKSWKNILNEYNGRAIWLSTNTRKLQPGQKIYYRIDGGIDQSYPEQAAAKEIKVIKE